MKEIPQLGTKEFNDSAMEMFGGKPKQQTAVEWLESKFDEFETIYDSLPAGLYEYVNQAKEMEKQQIEDAYWEGGQDIPLTEERCEQYYNETFNK